MFLKKKKTNLRRDLHAYVIKQLVLAKKMEIIIIIIKNIEMEGEGWEFITNKEYSMQ